MKLLLIQSCSASCHFPLLRCTLFTQSNTELWTHLMNEIW
jgi:hypothetical protein